VLLPSEKELKFESSPTAHVLLPILGR